MQLSVSHDATLYYDVVDLTPPWISNPQTIVFSHGVGTNSVIWHGWKPILAPFFRLVCLDTRGFGRSSRHGPGFPYSFDLWAGDILAVADVTGSEKFHLVGESMAGTAAQHLAGSERGQRLLSVTTCTAPYRGADLPRVGDWKEQLHREGVAAWSAKMMEQRFYPNALADAQYRWFAEEQGKSDADTLLGLGNCLLETDLTEALKRIQIPALILAADASPYVTPEIAAAMHRLIPHSNLQVIPNSRHGLPFSHGKECAEALLAHLQRKGFTALW